MLEINPCTHCIHFDCSTGTCLYKGRKAQDGEGVVCESKRAYRDTEARKT